MACIRALGNNTLRKWLLLVGSYVFYGVWDWRFLSLIAISTLIDYVAGLQIERTRGQTARRLWLGFSLTSNLGMLGFFKYFGFFVSSAQQLAEQLGLPFQTGTLNIILPVGISFYTFQTLSYTIDIYRGKLKATSSLLDFATFVAFFPQLVAGPIVRARDFLPQLERSRRWGWGRTNLGVQFVIMGLFKKLAIADRMAMFADPPFSAPEQFATGALWLATLAFAMQIYCDFSGYSDMAVGLAHMLGYKLTKNFDMPYLSSNLGELWRRWHISLSSWLRDYVYFPLGGRSRIRWRNNLSLFVTMTLCGLWHGAGATYVVFGAVHGCFLAFHRHFRDLCSDQPWIKRLLKSRPGTAVRVALTVWVFCLSLVIFRSPTLEQALTMFGRMFVMSTGNGPPLNERGVWYTLLVVAIAHAVGAWKLHTLAARVPAAVQGLAYAAAATAALVLCPTLGKAFVYFQF